MKQGVNIPIKIYLFFMLYACLYLFVSSTCSPLYPMNNSGDAHVYFIMGKGFFSNYTIYKDLFDHKGPFLYLIYGLGSLISRTNFFGIYVIECICLFINMVLSFKIASFFLNQKQSLMVSALFPIILLTGILVNGGSPEEFISPLIMGSFYFYLNYFNNQQPTGHSPKIAFFYGLSVMIVFLIKLSLIVFWAGLLLAISIQLLQKKQFKNLFLNFLGFILGLLIIALPFYIYSVRTNSFNDLIEAYWRFNVYYGSEVQSTKLSTLIGIPIPGISCLIRRLYYLLRTFPIECGTIIAGLLSLKRYLPNILERSGLLVSLILLFTLSYWQRGYPQYFIPICTFSIFGCITIMRILEDSKEFGFSRKALLLMTVLGIGWGFFRYKDNLLFLQYDTTVKTHFSPIVNQEKNPTLFAMRFPDGPVGSLIAYQQLNIMPNVKYFFCPVIDMEKYPTIFKEQVQYVKNKKSMFLCISSYSDSETIPTFVTDNYDLVSKTTGLEIYQGDTTDVYYFLYKVKKSDDNSN